MEMKEVKIVFAKILLCDMGDFLFTVIVSCGNLNIFYCAKLRVCGTDK
jgi:hypothetical protein